MLFPTLTFALFFALVLPVSWALRDRTQLWKVAILVASYIFYGWWDWRFLGLIITVTLVNEVAAVAVFRSEVESTRKTLVSAAVVANLGFLGFFKYYGFFISSLDRNLGISLPLLDVVLPVGISFFTFQGMSYVIDTYRRDVKPVPLLDAAVYLAFFPQLVAGPIVRATEFLPQLQNRRPAHSVEAGEAALLIGRGLFKKVVISSFLADAIVDDIFATPQAFGSLDVLFGIYGYAIQIYADFSGYTDIAIGIALLLGFQFPLNFDKPYAAVSFQDFWRRWHMTLSRWLRDYLYFPLGGNRGSKLKTYRNLALTMILGGLWHGAAGTFIAWGFYQGAMLGLERFVGDVRGEPDQPIDAADIRIQEIAALHTGSKLEPWRADPTSPVPFTPLRVRNVWVARFFTFHLVCVGWVLFRAESLDRAGEIAKALVGGLTDGPTLTTPLVVATIAASLAAQLVPPLYGLQARAAVSRLPPAALGIGLGLWLFVVAALGPEGVAPFIYFQF